GAVWPATGRGRTSVRRPSLPAAECRLSSLERVSRATEAEDPAYAPDDPATHRRPAARALGHGRPALGRSDHARIAQPPRRSRAHRAHPGAVDLSSRLQPTLDGALAPHPGDAQSLATAPGGGNDRPGGTPQGPTS